MKVHFVYKHRPDIRFFHHHKIPPNRNRWPPTGKLTAAVAIYTSTNRNSPRGRIEHLLLNDKSSNYNRNFRKHPLVPEKISNFNQMKISWQKFSLTQSHSSPASTNPFPQTGPSINCVGLFNRQESIP